MESATCISEVDRTPNGFARRLLLGCTRILGATDNDVADVVVRDIVELSHLQITVEREPTATVFLWVGSEIDATIVGFDQPAPCTATISRESACGAEPLAVLECVRCFHCGDGTPPVRGIEASPRNSRPEKSFAPIELGSGSGCRSPPTYTNVGSVRSAAIEKWIVPCAPAFACGWIPTGFPPSRV